jgi:hypothetical protein
MNREIIMQNPPNSSPQTHLSAHSYIAAMLGDGELAQAISFLDDAIEHSPNEFTASRMRWLHNFLETRCLKPLIDEDERTLRRGDATR